MGDLGGDIMYYMFSTGNLKYDVVRQIIDTGRAVKYGNFLLMSKESEFKIGNRTIKNNGTIDSWLHNFYLNKSVSLYNDVKIKYSEVADILIGELYQPCNDAEMTYADKIYQAKNPKETVADLHDEFLIVAIKNRLDNLQESSEEYKKLESRLKEIRSDIESGKCLFV